MECLIIIILYSLHKCNTLLCSVNLKNCLCFEHGGVSKEEVDLKVHLDRRA